MTAPADTMDDKCKLDFKSGKTLVRHMRENEFDFKTMSGKFNCDVSMNEDEHSINVSVRCRKDSAIWMNMSKATIDILRVLITRDSVKFMVQTSMGGLNKGYFAGDFSYINNALQADLDYDVIQALLYGNSADFLSDSVKLKGGKDKSNCQYFVSTIRKRQLQKVITGNPPKESVQAIWLHPHTWKIVQLEFDDVDTKRKFNACYEDFQPVENFAVPFKLLYTITAEKNIKAEIRWSRIKVNDEITFPYKVPESYEPLQLKKGPENGQVNDTIKKGP